MSRRVPLDLPPGVVRTESDYSQEGRYIAADKVRFYRDKPEKIGGWIKFSYQKFKGIARGLFGWSDNNSNIYVAVGTTCKLGVIQSPPSAKPAEIVSGWGAGGWGEGGWGVGIPASAAVNDLVDITPIVSSGNLTNPFTTTFGSKTVLVTDTDHGLAFGQTVNFSGASELAEITINGAYTVSLVVSTSQYAIEHAFTATFSESGGGTVAYEYELACGEVDVTVGRGYGVGLYGRGTYGTPRSVSGFIRFPRFWSLDNYNNLLLALPSSGALYQWNPATGGRATPIANAPTGNVMFVTSEGFIFILGADSDPMRVRWADQDNFTIWSPAATNSANTRVLRVGNRLVHGSAFTNDVNLVWSDTALFTFTFRGLGLVYQSRLVGRSCGLLGPQAFAVADNRAFWMSDHSFHTYSGFVREIPNVEDIREWVFNNLTEIQKTKVVCGYVSKFREVWWIYPSDTTGEPNRYIAVNIDDFFWTTGMLDRTSFFLFDLNDNRPLMTGADGFVYLHETGTDADGSAMEAFIEHAPVDIGDGDVGLSVLGYIPDFKRHTGNVEITVSSRNEPNSQSLLSTQTKTIVEGQSVVDLRVSGRSTGIRLSSNVVGGDFRQGKPLIEVEEQGGRRGG